MNLNFAGFIDSLQYMALGMGGIFVVTLLIVGVVFVLNKLNVDSKE